MITAPAPRLRCYALALLFSIVAVENGLAKPVRSSAIQRAEAESSDQSNAALDLAQQVGEIAHSSAISRAKKEKRISTAVRIAVTAATAYRSNPEEILGTALELTEAAAAAAPQFAEVISDAVKFAPSLGRVEGAQGQIRTAAFAAAKNPKSARKKNVAAARSRAAQPSDDEPVPVHTTKHTVRTVASEEPAAESPATDFIPDSAMADERPNAEKVSLGNNNSSFHVTSDLSVSRDNNIFLSNTTKTGDTIIAVTPGVDYTFGQNSLSHGTLSYKNAITRYANKSAPNAALSSGAADFGYDNGSLTLLGAASFQQSNTSVAGIGQSFLYRRDVLALDTSAESHLTAKTSVKTGINYNKSEYKTGGLVGSEETGVPLRIYLETSPKVSVFAGVGYRKVTPENGGTSTSKDLDYNIGGRGNFTAKLNGEISLDYRTRSVADKPKENFTGINGSLNYELTPKTTSSLVISNDFSTGALGESLKNSSYALRLAADPAPQWQLGTGLTYRHVEYGQSVFSLNNVSTSVNRVDRLWEGDVQATYLFRTWMTASASYTFRRNQSSLSAAEYSDSILSLILGFRY